MRHRISCGIQKVKPSHSDVHDQATNEATKAQEKIDKKIDAKNVTDECNAIDIKVVSPIGDTFIAVKKCILRRVKMRKKNRHAPSIFACREILYRLKMHRMKSDTRMYRNLISLLQNSRELSIS